MGPGHLVRARRAVQPLDHLHGHDVVLEMERYDRAPQVHFIYSHTHRKPPYLYQGYLLLTDRAGTEKLDVVARDVKSSPVVWSATGNGTDMHIHDLLQRVQIR